MHRRQRHRVVPPKLAREDLARSIGALVSTLSYARSLAEGGASGDELSALLARARRELDAADEKLLVLDRHRQRSLFRRAERIRSRLEFLHVTLSPRATHTSTRHSG